MLLLFLAALVILAAAGAYVFQHKLAIIRVDTESLYTALDATIMRGCDLELHH